MDKIKITINNSDRIVIIPIEHNTTTDSLDIKELQIEPMPEANEDISNDVVLYITKLIMDMFTNMSK